MLEIVFWLPQLELEVELDFALMRHQRGSLPFLAINFLSDAVLSRERAGLEVERSREELLELEEYDDSLSEPLESEEPAELNGLIPDWGNQQGELGLTRTRRT